MNGVDSTNPPNPNDEVLGAAERKIRRHPELMSRHDTGVLVIDVQEKLVPLVHRSELLVWNIQRTLRAAKLLSMPLLCSEQYPAGLGATVPKLGELLPVRVSKREFSCCGCQDFLGALRELEVSKWLLVGIETHVCVQQTALDLLSEGYMVFVACDATSARALLDHETALARMRSAGVTITTTEAAIFEWCQTSAAPEFKAISQIIREPGPGQT